MADVTAGLTAAWNASAAAEHAIFSLVDETTHITLTADVAGATAWVAVHKSWSANPK